MTLRPLPHLSLKYFNTFSLPSFTLDHLVLYFSEKRDIIRKKKVPAMYLYSRVVLVLLDKGPNNHSYFNPTLFLKEIIWQFFSFFSLIIIDSLFTWSLLYLYWCFSQFKITLSLSLFLLLLLSNFSHSFCNKTPWKIVNKIYLKFFPSHTLFKPLQSHFYLQYYREYFTKVTLVGTSLLHF